MILEVNKIYHGDCLDFLTLIRETFPEGNIAIVSDPPYGKSNDGDYTRFTNTRSKTNTFDPIINDNVEFNPGPWLNFKHVILWGSNYYGKYLPIGTTLVWLKKRGSQLNTFLSDCELAFQKGGEGVYLFHHVWHGHDRESERGQPTLHQSQKPVALMKWCINRQNLTPDTIIIDPYCGSGSTGVAAIELGFDFIGIDLDEKNVPIATKRLETALSQPRLLEPVKVKRGGKKAQGQFTWEADTEQE